MDLTRRQAIASAIGLISAPGLVRGEDPPNWVFLDNGTIRLGVKTDSGAGIGHLSASGSPRNFLNHFDKGRLIQQSYYGNPDGSVWVETPWRWNPVQGGDWKGTASKVAELKSTATTLYARTIPRNWAGCQELADVSMEEWIRLDGRVARVRYRMTYSGKTSNVEHDQEVPAFFVEPDLDTLVLYEGEAPWTGGALARSKPGWPNESRKMTEHWAAFVGANGLAVGAFVPIADRLTCYRYAAGHTSREGACSYFAPLIRFAITPGCSFEYDLYLAIGRVDDIRSSFRAIRDVSKPPESKGRFSGKHSGT